MANGSEKSIRVTLAGSPIGETQRVRQTLRGLRLLRRGRSVELADHPSVRGMIRRVAHLVRVELLSDE